MRITLSRLELETGTSSSLVSELAWVADLFFDLFVTYQITKIKQPISVGAHGLASL